MPSSAPAGPAPDPAPTAPSRPAWPSSGTSPASWSPSAPSTTGPRSTLATWRPSWPACRQAAPRRLGVLRRFFGWARAHRLVLVDPTATLTAGRQRGFSGQVLTIAEQRRLYRRWTSDPQTHPHECLVGLFALLHGAAGAELRGLRIADLDPARRTVRLGRRPHPVPLDPASWLALERCLALRAELGTHNPHLLVTRVTKTGTAPASEAYLAHVLDPAGVPPRRLRATRLADLVVTLDPKLVAEAFGLDPDGVLAYLADHVQEARLPNLPAATPAELAEHPGGAR